MIAKMQFFFHARQLKYFLKFVIDVFMYFFCLGGYKNNNDTFIRATDFSSAFFFCFA